MNIPKLLRPFLKLTSDSKNPTDELLDVKIQELHFITPHVYSLLTYIVKEKTKRFFKYQYKVFLTWGAIISIVFFGIYYTMVTIVEPIISKYTNGREVQVEKIIYSANLRTFDQLMNDVGFKESSNRWDKVNEFGMMGHFQFQQSTLDAIGIKVSKQDFLENRDLQRGAFIQLLKENQRTFRKYINMYNFKQLPGVKGTITESGILMSFHLKPNDAKVYFDSKGKNAGNGDGNGTKVTEYIEKFSGYEIPF